MNEWDTTNASQYASEESVATLSGDADAGLSDRERRAIRTYFTDEDVTVLDLGCATGRTTGPLAAAGYDVVGLDVSEPLLRRAESRLDGVDFSVGTAAGLPFADATFEYVLFAYNGLDYLTPARERMAALAEIHRVLRPGGTFVFSSHNSWYLVPALLADRSYVRDKYLANGNPTRVFDPVKRETARVGVLETYFSNPWRQREQLRTAGFELLDVIGKRDGIGKYFETFPYYVARKPAVPD